MSAAPTASPDWDHLFEIAAAQDGLFTTKQAAEAGYSPQLLAQKHAPRVRVSVIDVKSHRGWSHLWLSRSPREPRTGTDGSPDIGTVSARSFAMNVSQPTPSANIYISLS